MAAFECTWVLLREALRALATPFRLLWWLPQRRDWVARAEHVLARQSSEPIRDPAGDSGTPAELEGFFARRPTEAPRDPHVFVSAGESSGETHAAHLMQAMGPGIRVTGFGGERMQTQGAELLYPLADHAIMGIGGVLRALPVILRAFARFLDHIDRDRPDLIVLVDYPGLHLVMAEAAQRRGIPVLHYVAPQYWAWGPWRMKRYRKAMDGTLTILPFEAAFFRDAGLPSHYIGHPLLDELAEADDDTVEQSRREGEPRLLVLMPGSRRAEIEANLPGMLEVATELRARHHPEVRTVVVHRNPKREAPIRAILQANPQAHATLEMGELAPHLRRAHLVLAKSGTGSLEAALYGIPTVVVYRVGRFGLWVSKRLLTVPFIAGANLIAGKKVLPEFVFRDDSTWREVTDAADALWEHGEGFVRGRCLDGLDEVRARLGAPGAAERAAGIVRAFVGLA